MKILRIISRLNIGGPARHVVWLTKDLERQGFESRLIAGTVPSGEGDMSYFAADYGVNPLYISSLTRELGLKDVASVWNIFREIRRYRPDVVCTHTAKAGATGRVAAFLYRWVHPGILLGRPRRLLVTHTFHGHVFHSYYGRLKTRVFLTVEKILARLATDAIVVISDQQFREIHGQFGVGRAQQFHVIKLGIDLDGHLAKGTGELRREIGAGASEMIVTFVGRLTEVKDVPLLLNAFALMRNAPAMRLVVAGNGNLRESLEQLTHQLGIEDKVNFLGSRERIAELIADSDVVAMCSLNEGTPLSLIEAMAAGKAVISTTVGGVIDLLGDRVETMDGFALYERGIGVEGRDPAAFLNGLIYLAENEQLRERLGIAGQDFVFDNYSKERMERDMAALYRELVPLEN